MRSVFFTLCAALMMVGCTIGKKTVEESANRYLVIYYSQTGATKTLAEEIQKQLGADIEAIEVADPYDGDFKQTVARCQKEMETGDAPAIKPIKADIRAYDEIFIGYPVWCGTYARPIESLLKEESFRGCDIVTFCTFGSGGLESSTEAMREALPKATVAEGIGIRGSRIEKAAEEVNRFLVTNGYKSGEVERLVPFAQHHPVNDEEKKIFDKACKDYQYPLGKAVDVARREAKEYTEYEFTAASKDSIGDEISSTIYVIVEKKEGAKPEFTKVVR